MRFFIDTEFEELGANKPISLISIGIVAEDGRELYVENEAIATHRLGEWLQKNVVPHLRGPLNATHEIAAQIQQFIPPRPRPGQKGYEEWVAPEFWGYFADYDWVLFCQLFGTMMKLPNGYPMYCMDLMQLAKHLGIPRNAFPKQEGTEHHALSDARWNKTLYEFLMNEARKSRNQT